MQGDSPLGSDRAELLDTDKGLSPLYMLLSLPVLPSPFPKCYYWKLILCVCVGGGRRGPAHGFGLGMYAEPQSKNGMGMMTYADHRVCLWSHQLSRPQRLPPG